MACSNWLWNGFNANLLSYTSSHIQWVFPLPAKIAELSSSQQIHGRPDDFVTFSLDVFPPSVAYFVVFKRALKQLDSNWLWDSLQYQYLILYLITYTVSIRPGCKDWWTLFKAVDSWNTWRFCLNFSHDCISSSVCPAFRTQAGFKWLDRNWLWNGLQYLLSYIIS